MDNELVNSVIEDLCNSGNYTDEKVSEIAYKLQSEDYESKATFENLRLHFTDLFLQHPDMLGKNTFKGIVDKAGEFTKYYIEYDK